MPARWQRRPVHSAGNEVRFAFQCLGPAVEWRGLRFRPAASEVEELQARGLSNEAIVDELLAIEIEMWQSIREGIA